MGNRSRAKSDPAVAAPLHGSILLRRWRGKDSCLTASRKLDCDPTVIFRVEKCERDASWRFARTCRDIAGIPLEAWELPKPTPEQIKAADVEAAS